MSWIPITIDTLYEAKTAALIDACDTTAGADGQGARSPGLIQGVVDEIRRKVGSCQTNRVDNDATTIPSGLRDCAVDMIIARLKTAIEIDLTEDERKNLDRRTADLNRIADCKDVVDQPDNPIPAPYEVTAPAPAFGKRHRKFTRWSQDG
jgi:hypothetical protein